MLGIKEVVVRIPINSTVVSHPVPFYLLGIVFALRFAEQPHERRLIGDELRIGAVHQAYGRHLFKRDGIQLTKQCLYVRIE